MLNKLHTDQGPAPLLLAIDADGAALDLYRNLAAASRWDFYGVHDSRRAVPAFNALDHHPDAIILSLNMPFMDGSTVIKLLRHAGYEGPIYLITREDKERAVENFTANLVVMHKPEALIEIKERLTEVAAWMAS